MAKPITLPYSKMLILIGDGATPTEVFEAPAARAIAKSDKTVVAKDGLNFTFFLAGFFSGGGVG